MNTYSVITYATHISGSYSENASILIRANNIKEAVKKSCSDKEMVYISIKLELVEKNK